MSWSASVVFVTPNPYVDDPRTGRVRHLYVHPDHRRGCVGGQLIRALEERASRVYTTLRLRTDTIAAAGFYEAMGYEPITDGTATHATTFDVRRPEVSKLP